jgi:hypothetical protein
MPPATGYGNMTFYIYIYEQTTLLQVGYGIRAFLFELQGYIRVIHKSHALLGLSSAPHLMLHPLLAVVRKVMKFY